MRAASCTLLLQCPSLNLNDMFATRQPARNTNTLDMNGQPIEGDVDSCWHLNQVF